jgi:DNA polymerase I-like protein with 3'-5' exonuclease and polymerase domains
MISKELMDFPKPCSPERPIPPEVWPDMPGVLKAKVQEWGPTVEEWREFWKTAARFPLFAADAETSGLRPFHGDKVAGWSAAFFDGKKIQAGYWNFRHCGHAAHGEHAPKCKTPKAVGLCKSCGEFVCPGYVEKAPTIDPSELRHMNAAIAKCIWANQNLKFDVKMGYTDGVLIPERALDTMLIAHLWDENKGKKGYKLENLAVEMGEEKLKDIPAEYMKEHGIRVEESGHARIPYEVERPYAIMDSVLILRRMQWERDRWSTLADPKIMDIFRVENACTPAYSFMEIPGMKLDVPYTREGVKMLEAQMLESKKKILTLAKKDMKNLGMKEFKILSNDDLWKILEARGHKALSLTPAGDPCLEDANLAAYHDPLADAVREYRSSNKMCGTYFKAYLEDYVDEKGVLQRAHADPDGFIHSNYFIHGTVSGRTSSTEPNLQNVTKFEKFGTKTKAGTVAKALHEGLKNEKIQTGSVLEVRRCFVPRGPEYSLFFFDYAQMELRVFSDYAEEEFMLSELMKGVDLHASVAKEVFPSMPRKEDNKTLYEYFRQLTKQINFGIIYGMGKNKLALQLDVPVDEAVRALELVKAGYAAKLKMKQYTDLTLDDCAGILEDHRVMTQSRQWSGLKTIGREVLSRVNPAVLVPLLVDEKAGKNMRLLYSADAFLRSYHARFPKIKVFTKAIDKAIRARGYVFNKFGRRYHLTPDKSYVGVNRLIQGTCGDMKKLAAWRIYKLLTQRKAKTKMLNDVHDELQFDVHHSELDLIPEIKECMENFRQVGVKMQVDADYSHVAWSFKRKWVGPEEFKKSLEEHREKATAKA